MNLNDQNKNEVLLLLSLPNNQMFKQRAQNSTINETFFLQQYTNFISGLEKKDTEQITSNLESMNRLMDKFNNFPQFLNQKFAEDHIFDLMIECLGSNNEGVIISVLNFLRQISVLAGSSNFANQDIISYLMHQAHESDWSDLEYESLFSFIQSILKDNSNSAIDFIHMNLVDIIFKVTTLELDPSEAMLTFSMLLNECNIMFPPDYCIVLAQNLLTVFLTYLSRPSDLSYILYSIQSFISSSSEAANSSISLLSLLFVNIDSILSDNLKYVWGSFYSYYNYSQELIPQFPPPVFLPFVDSSDESSCCILFSLFARLCEIEPDTANFLINQDQFSADSLIALFEASSFVLKKAVIKLISSLVLTAEAESIASLFLREDVIDCLVEASDLNVVDADFGLTTGALTRLHCIALETGNPISEIIEPYII